MNENESMHIFFEIHHNNPQEGPGDFASTKRALSLLKDLPPSPKILDVGCGPGRQTVDLCRMTNGGIVAVDFHQPYVDALRQKSKDLGLMERISVMQADMKNLQFEPQSFDLIWSEGSIYIIGFKAGLEMWKPLLKKGGYIAVTELTWLQFDVPDELKVFMNEEYPQMQDIESNLEDLQVAGYKTVGHFTLPESAWWDYYRPIKNRVMLLQKKYKNNSSALAILEMEIREIDLYRKYSDYYGYVFYVGQAV